MAQFEGSGKLIVDGTGQKVLDLRFTNTVRLTLDGANSVEISGCTFDSSSGIVQASASSQVQVHDNLNSGGTFIDGGGFANDEWQITDNINVGNQGCVNMKAHLIVIADNHFNTPASGETVGYAVELTGDAFAYGVTVRDNVTVSCGIYVEAVVGAVSISGNQMVDFDESHGIHLVDCSNAVVRGNNLKVFAMTADDTFDGIHVEGNSDNNMIFDNLIETVADQLRYGVNIADSTCDNNIVVGNNLGPVADYGTGALNNAGTGTVLTYPNDATYGDNFVA